jgi:uncharacterized membrane protein YphA (DoxX/SURF4 family)
MDTALWITSWLLAAVFLASGIAKSSMSRERLIASGQTGIAPFPMPVVRATAVAEIAGAAGLIAPWLTDVAPVLTPIAAIGLGIVMCGAQISHASLREPRSVAINLALLIPCAFVAAGRLAQLF